MILEINSVKATYHYIFMGESLKNKTLKGTFWSTIERLSVQCVGFVVMIIMARVISPAAYGLVGMIAIFIDVSQSLVDSGFSQALIRKQDRSEVDNSTVFYFNIVVGMVLYAILYFCAPLISHFYEQPELRDLLRVIGLSVVINSFVVVQRALLTSDMDFKTQARASFIAALVSGGVGIAMAYTGFGVWAIVVYQLTNLTVNNTLLWIYSSWHPIKAYDWKSFKELFGFGSKLAAAGLLNTIFSNAYLLVIGKFYDSKMVGYYTRAQQFGAFLSSNITQILQRVTYPALCTIQNDRMRLLEAYKMFLRLSAFVVFPLMIGLASLSEPLIFILLTDKWAFAAQLLPVLCLSMMWFPIHAINLNMLQVTGKSNLFLKVEIYKKIITVIVIVVTIKYGMMAIVWGQVVNSIIALWINTYYTGKLMDYGFWKQLRDLLPALFNSLLMGVVIISVNHYVESIYMKLIIGVVAGVAWYLCMAVICKSKEIKYILKLIKDRKRVDSGR